MRAPDGRLASINRVRDLMPHVVPITTADQALAYVWFISLFRIAYPFGSDTPPGLGAAGPNRFGVAQGSMEEDPRREGVDADPRIQSLPGGFAMTRLVVVADVEDGRPTYRLVRIRERVTRDGEYEAEILETVRSDEPIARWVVRPL